MSFIEDYHRLRPFMYHLTAGDNVSRLKRLGVIECASDLATKAGRGPLRQRRHGPLSIDLDGEAVIIRDQDPLFEGNIQFEGGWVFTDLLDCLNSYVFFWAGRESGPVVS